MGNALAAYVTDVLLVGAGFGLLLALGLTPRGPLRAVGAIGLAYMVGVAAVPLALTVLLVVGIPVTFLTFAIVVIICALAGAWRFARSTPGPRPARVPWRSWRPDTWVIVAFVAVFGAVCVVGFLAAIHAPLFEWDAWSIWERKARMLTEHDNLWHPFFSNATIAHPHLDYPLQLPIWEALHGRAAGELNPNHVLGWIWLLEVAFIWGAAYLVHVYGRVRPVVWAPVLLLVAVAPGVLTQLNGDADLPMAFLACLGVASMGFWLKDGDRSILALAAIFLAATANTKNEGTAAVIAVLVVAFVITLVRKLDWRSYVTAAVGVVLVGVVPWHLWISAHSIEPEIQISTGLKPGYLIEHFDRVGPAISALNNQLSDPERWVYLVPIAALLVAFSLVSGLGRRVAAFYLGAFALVWAIFVWNYWISPIELSWYLETSDTRVVSVPIFICIAAILHLAGIYVGELERFSRRFTRSAERG
jgi:hypothetical protein